MYVSEAMGCFLNKLSPAVSSAPRLDWKRLLCKAPPHALAACSACAWGSLSLTLAGEFAVGRVAESLCLVCPSWAGPVHSLL